LKLFSLKLKISFDEILPPGVPLNAGTQNSSQLILHRGIASAACSHVAFGKFIGAISKSSHSFILLLNNHCLTDFHWLTSWPLIVSAKKHQ
jgi:hypothetical protein